MNSRAVFALAGLGAALLLLTARKPTSSGGSIVEPIRELVSGPRGLRNNNPGNIVRTKDAWKGMSADQSADNRFVVFDAPVWGLRALARILRGYIAGGNTSIAQIISKWAPTNENNTQAYINAVSASMGISPFADVGLDDYSMSKLMAAIVQHENGQQPFDSNTFYQAIQLERSA